MKTLLVGRGIVIISKTNGCKYLYAPGGKSEVPVFQGYRYAETASPCSSALPLAGITRKTFTQLFGHHQ